MKKTRFCDLLGIEYPIIQGGMDWIANAELAAAVSEAGGLGLISPNAGSMPGGNIVENLRLQIRKAKGLTRKPFGANFPLQHPDVKRWLEVALEEGVRAFTVSAGSPAVHTKFLKDAGARVIHVVASARHARRAEAEGVDAVVAEGYEAGGHNGLDELPTFVLVPQVVDAVKIPVVAAGGIADGRGFLAALALGAEGVQIGTRFVATTECMAHPSFKKAILEAADTGTAITGRKLGPTRILRGEVATQLLEMEARGASAQELEAFLGPGRAYKGQVEGNLKEGGAYCGAIAGMIKEVLPAGEVVRRIIREADEILARMR